MSAEYAFNKLDSTSALQLANAVNLGGQLTLAGNQGLAEAWFVLSRIYTKPEFSQRNVVEAHSCLERAADLGHGPAQLECGMHAWRNRRDGVNNDVRAAYWLLQAQAQGSSEAEAALALAQTAYMGGFTTALLGAAVLAAVSARLRSSVL